MSSPASSACQGVAFEVVAIVVGVLLVSGLIALLRHRCAPEDEKQQGRRMPMLLSRRGQSSRGEKKRVQGEGKRKGNSMTDAHHH